MRTHRDAEAIAEVLRDRLSDKQVTLSRDDFPLYAQISRSGLKLHLSEHHGDASPGSTVLVWMRGIAAYHRELTDKNYRYYKPGLEDAVWDGKVMEVGDPFGNRLRFGERNEPDAAD